MPSQRNEIKDIKRKLLRSNYESLYVYETMQQTGVNHSLINGTMTANISQRGSTPASSALLWIDEPHFSKIIRYVIYCLLFVFAIGGNATVCIIPFRHRRMRTCTYFLITNLAVSDIGTMLCLPYILVMEWQDEWSMGLTMCKLVNPSLTLFYLVTTNTLVAIAVHRFVVLVFPFRSKPGKSKVALIILLTWLTAFLCVLPSFAARELEPRFKENGEVAYDCSEIFPGETGEERQYYQNMYTIFQYTINIALPVVIIVALYIGIAYKLRQMALALGRGPVPTERRDSGASVSLQSTFSRSRTQSIFSRKSSIDQASARKRNELEKKFLRMLAIVVLIFVVCYVPYTTFFLVVPHYPEALYWKYLKIFYHYIYLLMWFPNALNPLCYGALDEHYASVIKALCRGKRRNGRGHHYAGNSQRHPSLFNNNSKTLSPIVEQSYSPAGSSNSATEERKKTDKKSWKVLSGSQGN